MPTFFPLFTLVENIRRFAFLNKNVVETFFLQIYILALIFYPVGSIIR